ncbi:MAG TPA: universal stress protein [Actinomycetota bacterium]|nr:universal stress protein [Actinomycetota bacterium]
MFSRILAGTDGSDTAAVAVAHAGALAAKVQAELVLVSAYRRSGGDDSPLGADHDHAEDDVARSIVEHEARRLGDRLGLRTVVQEGNPTDVILDIAEEQAVDLIVVGNKGMAGARRFFLGSVPNNVAHHAPCHVLIAHTVWAERTDDPLSVDGPLYGKVLIATDGSPTAREAVHVGAELAAAIGAQVLLLHVGDPDRGKGVLEEAEAALGGQVGASSATMEGDPAERILDVAAGEGADLIVVGNKGMTGARRFLMGSVPNNVAHHAETNVLIAKTA